MYRRRCKFGVTTRVRAAWLRSPSFTLEPLEQYYTRIDEATYRYESASRRFAAELKVSPAGFVIMINGGPTIYHSAALEAFRAVFKPVAGK